MREEGGEKEREMEMEGGRKTSKIMYRKRIDIVPRMMCCSSG